MIDYYECKYFLLIYDKIPFYGDILVFDRRFFFVFFLFYVKNKLYLCKFLIIIMLRIIWVYFFVYMDKRCIFVKSYDILNIVYFLDKY